MQDQNGMMETCLLKSRDKACLVSNDKRKDVGLINIKKKEFSSLPKDCIHKFAHKLASDKRAISENPNFCVIIAQIRCFAYIILYPISVETRRALSLTIKGKWSYNAE